MANGYESQAISEQHSDRQWWDRGQQAMIEIENLMDDEVTREEFESWLLSRYDEHTPDWVREMMRGEG